MQPKPSADTSRLLVPSLRVFIAFSFAVAVGHSALRDAMPIE
jgi:hypothetical protein